MKRGSTSFGCEGRYYLTVDDLLKYLIKGSTKLNNWDEVVINPAAPDKIKEYMNICGWGLLCRQFTNETKEKEAQLVYNDFWNDYYLRTTSAINENDEITVDWRQYTESAAYAPAPYTTGHPFFHSSMHTCIHTYTQVVI